MKQRLIVKQFRKLEETLSKTKLISIVIMLLISISILFILPFSFASIQPVRSIEIFSENSDYNKKEPGSWKITKSAKWVEKGVAEITFDVDSIMSNSNKNMDVLFVLDISGSMDSNKLSRVKTDAIDLITSLSTGDNNRVGLITFSDFSNIVSEMTIDAESLIKEINSLSADGHTNYYSALSNVNLILEKYAKDSEKNFIVLFLTDGYPTAGTPHDEIQYTRMKKMYPFVTFNAIQYEMGNEILDPIRKISDNQYLAKMENLNNVLFEASAIPISYEKFEIRDYIDTDYFYVEDSKDISAKYGDVNFDKENQKVTWTIDGLASGSTKEMKIRAKLKDESILQGEDFSTNKKEEIESEFEDAIENVTSSKTPILSSKYNVTYDGNAPSGCSLTNVPEASKEMVFDIVKIDDKVLKCDNYQFKGWKIVTKDIKKINDDYFIMPENDVAIRAEWSKLDIKKSMDGTISEELTLYKQVKLDYENGKSAQKYTGATNSFTGNKDIYYYNTNNANNNVIFGGFCWRIYRTTDTGGVKVIYNGEPDSEGRCGATRGNHVGYGAGSNKTLTSTYLYGTDYTYNASSKTFTLTGEKEQAAWNGTSYPNLLGKYTCLNTTGSCATLYYVNSYASSTMAYTIPLNSSTVYSQIGVSAFNVSANSPADVGYMYNKRYTFQARVYKNTGNTTIYSFGNSFTYDETTGMYSLSGATQSIIDSDISYGSSNLNNTHYTCWNESGTCTTLSYVFYVGTTSSYYINLQKGISVEMALKEMLTAEDVNTKNSTIKNLIDLWYSRNLLKYTNYFEDTIWCGSRKIAELNGWNPNGGLINKILTFWPYFNKSNLTCPEKRDSFTVNEKNGNGALTYPVGLITFSEYQLAYTYSNTLKSSALASGGDYNWMLSPNGSWETYAGNCAVAKDGIGHFEVLNVSSVYGVRPSVSLRSGIAYTAGDGSFNNPYVIEMNN